MLKTESYKQRVKHVVVIIPSYNARYNITKVVDKILRTVKNVKIIIVDDNSPDNTAELISSRYEKNNKVRLIVRNKKAGRGSAVIEGIKEGLKDKTNQYFIEMDADFSHDPKYIPKLIESCQSKDIAIASKYLKSSKILGMPFKRKIISIFANIFFKLVLRIPLSDYTNGFRCYTRKAVTAIDLRTIKAKGFIVLSEIAYAMHQKKLSFGEIPIQVKYYKEAGSNFNINEIKESIVTISQLFATTLFFFPFLKKLFLPLYNHKEIFLLFTLTIIFFHKIILNTEEMIYPAYDIGIYSFWKHFITNSIKEFSSLPLWNPFMFGGNTFVGRSESAMFYPINFLYMLFPPDLVFGYVFMIDVFLIGLFTYLFAREILLDKYSALLSGVIFMFSGPIIAHILPAHIFIMDGIVWFPLLILLYQKGIRTRDKKYWLLSSIPLALMLLSGNPQIALYSLLAIGFFFLFRFLTELQHTKFHILKNLLFLPIVSTTIGILLAAVQIIPSMELSKHSIRSDGLNFAFSSDFSLHPYQLIMAIFPNFFGSSFASNTFWGINGSFDSSTIYSGILALILALYATIFKRNIYTLFFLFLGIFSLLFAIGRFGPLFSFFYHFIPGFDLFRVPTRFLFLYSFSLAMLAGIGCSFLIKQSLLLKEKDNIKTLTYIIFFISFLSALLFFFISHYKHESIRFFAISGYAIGNNLNRIHSLIISDLLKFSIISLTSSVITWFFMKKNYKSFFLLLIFAIVIIDVWPFAIQFYTTKNPHDVFITTPEIKKIKKDNSFFRIFDMGGSTITMTGKNNIQTLTGFEAMYLKDYRDFLWRSGSHENTPFESFFQFHTIDNLTILRLLNTKYIISKKSLSSPELKLYFKNSNYVYEIMDTLPRAYITRNVTTVQDRKEILNIIIHKNFDYKNSAIFEKKIIPLQFTTSSIQKVDIKQYQPNKIVIETKLDTPGYLILSEIWYPGWKAYDNEKIVEIYRANYIFRSIYLKQGNHKIVFQYEPFSYKIGFLVSSITATSVLAFILFNRNKQCLSRRRSEKD